MSEEELLKAGYKYIEGKHPEECDKYYRKCLGEGKTISAYYYEADEFEGPEFEFEYFEIEGEYTRKIHLYGIDESYTVQKIENILLK